ncbi:MAG: hypothetical protein ACLSG8_07565 [Barnesiella sp.]
MKKIFILFMIDHYILCVCTKCNSANGVSYPVDTLVHKHDVGPGTRYAYYNLPTMPLSACHGNRFEESFVDIETCLGER